MTLKLEPLGITCTSTDCENGLHCFRQTKKSSPDKAGGKCRSCGIDLVDWDRVYTRDLNDVDYTFQVIKKELIRHHFWHKPMDEEAVNHARRKGKLTLREATRKRIQSSVGPESPFRDGAQTPKKGRAYYYAQHATASCCRKCIEEWHGIPQGRDLTASEIDYLANLATLYIEERLPNLTEEGEKIPRRSLKRLSSLAKS